MKKYLKIYLNTFKLNLMDQMIHRANFLTWFVVHIVDLILDIVFFKIIYLSITSLNGWSIEQVLVLLGVYLLVAGLGSITFFSFMYHFGWDIQNGDFDFTLTRPIDPLFASAFSWVDIEDISNVWNGLILIGVMVWRLNPPHLFFNTIGFAVMLFSAMLLLFSILTLIQSLAFRAVNITSSKMFFWSIVNLSRYPVKVFQSVPTAVRSLLVPIAFITTIPAEVLFGRWDWPWIVGSVSMSLALFLFSRWVFMTQLRNYASASS